MAKTTNELYPPVRFPRTLRDELQKEANDLARDRGRESMSIADFVAEMLVAWRKANTDLDEEG